MMFIVQPGLILEDEGRRKKNTKARVSGYKDTLLS